MDMKMQCFRTTDTMIRFIIFPWKLVNCGQTFPPSPSVPSLLKKRKWKTRIKQIRKGEDKKVSMIWMKKRNVCHFFRKFSSSCWMTGCCVYAWWYFSSSCSAKNHFKRKKYWNLIMHNHNHIMSSMHIKYLYNL